MPLSVANKNKKEKEKIINHYHLTIFVGNIKKKYSEETTINLESKNYECECRDRRRKKNSLLIGSVGKQRMTKQKAISEPSTGNWGINNKPRKRNIQKQQQLPNTNDKSPLNELQDTLCSKGNERKMTTAKADAELC